VLAHAANSATAAAHPAAARIPRHLPTPPSSSKTALSGRFL